MLAFALFCCFQKKKHKKKKTQETEVIHFDEHKTVKETILPGPFGQKTVVITVEDDVHVDEEIRKNEEVVGHGHGLHDAKTSSSSPITEAEQAGNTSSTVEVATASSDPEHHHDHHLIHKHEENKPSD